jgi:hypothetical protein
MFAIFSTQMLSGCIMWPNTESIIGDYLLISKQKKIEHIIDFGRIQNQLILMTLNISQFINYSW